MSRTYRKRKFVFDVNTDLRIWYNKWLSKKKLVPYQEQLSNKNVKSSLIAKFIHKKYRRSRKKAFRQKLKLEIKNLIFTNEQLSQTPS